MKTPFILLLFFVWGSANAVIWKVGPNETYKFCSAVAALVNDGDTVDISAADYVNDVQVQWTKNNLLIRGRGGRPRLIAGSLIANDAVNGKGIFVIKGNNITVENLEFRNAQVKSHNGAGIRQEGLKVLIRHCRFEANEMGVLGGNTAAGGCIIIEYSEFLNGGSTADPGYQHNIYIANIDSFIFRYNWTSDAIAEGHELKSRARNNFILYNRISNINTSDSRNIDIPNGGTLVVLGNIIEQGFNSSNSNMLAYGLEGLINPGPHNVFVCNNTFVNKKDKGSFVHVASGCDTLLLKNNILAGPKTGGLIIGSPVFLDSSNNLISDFVTSAKFVNPSGFDYHLLPESPAINAGKVILKMVKGYSLNPLLQYRDTCSFELRNVLGAIDIGALEFENITRLKKIKAVNNSVYGYVQQGRLFLPGFNLTEITHALIYSVDGEMVKELSLGKDELTAGSLSIDGLAPGRYFALLKCKTDFYPATFFVQ